MLENGNFRCDQCNELLPDIMLWIEVHGTYKVGSKYFPIRWDFCDLHCHIEYLTTKDWSRVAVAKHKTAKQKLKDLPKNERFNK